MMDDVRGKLFYSREFEPAPITRMYMDALLESEVKRWAASYPLRYEDCYDKRKLKLLLV